MSTTESPVPAPIAAAVEAQRIADESQPTPPPAPAPGVPSETTDVPVTPAQPAQAPPAEQPAEPEDVAGPAADVDRELAKMRAEDGDGPKVPPRNPRTAMAAADEATLPPAEPAVPAGKKMSSYVILYSVLPADASPETSDLLPVNLRVWTGPTTDVLDAPAVVTAGTQRTAKESALAQDARLLAVAEAGRLWIVAVPAKSWLPSRPQARQPREMLSVRV